ncbi:MAG: IS30 family transposase [Minisyncoccota bacterium]
MKKKYQHLKNEERFVIEKMWCMGVTIRYIATVLGRSPNTISGEIKKNVVNGVYEAKKAIVKVSARRWRAKQQCLKVAMDRFLTIFVEERLSKPYRWSPKQISGYLREEMGIQCSAKAIYKFAESRGLEYLLFWGWNRHKGGRKRGHWKSAQDGRKYIEERPVSSELGHLEMDFIVSKESSWVLLVVVDRVAKRTWIRKLPNRKRSTIRAALSSMFHGVTLQSITTDNDIAFTCWRELEVLLNTCIYFTHPYHSWEKGLVENTNRWIRCFVPKRRDIKSVTEEELNEIHSFLNDRPREVLGFRTPMSYYLNIQSVLLEG